MSYLRSGTSLSFLLVILSFSHSAHAAGAYAQPFDSDPPADWVEAADSWTATNGYYVNTNTAPYRAIAFLGGRRWQTDFTYSLRMYSDLGGYDGHRAGVVFHYVDDMNYYDVSISMLGTVELAQVSGGVRTSLKTAQAANLARDVWFDVAIVRTGSNKVKVRVGNVDVLAYDQLPNPPLGYIGVLSQFNWSRFDDVKVTPVIFRAGFGDGVSVTPENKSDGCVGPVGAKKYQVNLTGTETATGTVWPPSFWGPPAVVLMNTILGCDQTFSDYLAVSLKNVTSPYGESTRVLSNTVKDVTIQPDGNIPRLGLGYTPDAGGDDPYANVPNRFYVRRYLKYSSALEAPGASKWFVQHEIKGSSCALPRRLTLYWNTNIAGEPYYRLRMDQENNCGVENSTQPVAEFPDQMCFPRQGGACPDFTEMSGQWFYDEYFVQYSGGGSSSDRVAYAINGQVIFNYTSPVRTAKPRLTKLTPGYTNIANLEVQVDDLEIYHDAPCRTFPCGPPSHY